MLLTVVVLLAAAGAPPPSTEKAPETRVLSEKETVDLDQTDNVRLSLPTEQDETAWTNAGLHLHVGYGYGPVQGTGPAWSFRSHTVSVRPNVRLDRHWALGATLAYGTGPSGLRWSVTADPTFYLLPQLGFSLGLGYGGLSISDVNRTTGRLRGPDETVSRTLVEGETLQSCGGLAFTSLMRAEYLFVAGPLFASGPFAQGNAQWTRCEATFGRSNPETGRPVVLSQWWRQHGATFGWWFAWR
jgi:hypothetical protein